jgi:hypothetical protein
MTANEQTRTERIHTALEALPRNHETFRVPWRGGIERMAVIKIGLDSVVYNPRSHRIKSQLESEQAIAAAVAADPDSEEAQAGIRSLLRATRGYERLKENLRAEGQREPGIMTRSGRLINANTRAAALEEMGEEYIEVAVLPLDATLGEIDDLELDLQVAEDYKQDYSFTNELLFVDDLISEHNRDERDIADRLRWITSSKQSAVRAGIERVRQSVRMLALIRAIQQASGGKVRLTDFDDAAQTLQEFDSDYEALRTKDPVAADRMKQARILGLLVNLGYERQREVDASWVETYLADALVENELLQELVDPLAEAETAEAEDDETLEGLGELEETDETHGEDGTDAAKAHKVVSVLVAKLGHSAQEETVTLPTADGPKEFQREAVTDAVNDAMRTAADEARTAARAGDALKLPIAQAKDAGKKLAKALDAYGKVKDDSDFDFEAFKHEVERAERALDALKSGAGI